MTYQAGDRLGSYEILEEIGSGGMGTVYKARDVRLERTVALKVLAGVDSPARRERLKREAKAIAKLNHPNICSLFDVGEHDGVYFLVLELIEGETLDVKLARGPLPLREALRIGAEVADGLAAAHREGIVHRDLKPGNVMLTRSAAKILDFGLARSATSESGKSDEDSRPTLSRGLTAEGMVVGTPWYMAPEQVTGEKADGRADLFALGVVLYEMIAGRRPFAGETPSRVTASILKDDPPRLEDAVPGCPFRVGQLVEACLAKDREARWQSASDLGRELRWSASKDAGLAKRTPSAVRWVPWLLMAAALLTLAVTLLGRRRDAFTVEALAVAPPPGTSFGHHPALTPDGRTIAFVAAGAAGGGQLWIRSLITAEEEKLVDVRDDAFLTFTPDGEELTWFDTNVVKSFALRDRVERIVLEGHSGPRGIARSSDGLILLAPHSRSPLYLAREARERSDELRAVTELDEREGEISHRHPQFLPDGEHFLFLALTSDVAGAAYVGSVSEGKLARLVDTTSPAIYADGYLFYVQDGALVVHRFDTASLTLKGTAKRIVPSVGAPPGFPANVAVSENGVLAYGPEPWPELPTRLLWYDREGNELGELGQPAHYRGIALSADGERVAATVGDRKNRSYDVWTIDGRGVSTRLTTTPLFDAGPVWAPSGDRLVFTSDRGGANARSLYVDALGDGEPPRWLLDLDGFPDASDWDRRDRIWFSLSDASFRRDIWVWSDGAAEPFLASEYDEITPRVSPDGAWLAFVSDETGRREVYVQPLGRPGEKRRISHDGGVQPRWRADGRELFYLDPESTVMAARFDAVYAGRDEARALFRPQVVPGSGLVTGDTYAPAPDGQRFLIIEKPPDPPPYAYTVLLNWRRALDGR